VIRRIDPVGRLAYGVLCIAGMAALALPVLVVAGGVAGIFIAAGGDGTKGLAVWLLSWASAAFAALLFLAIFYTMWPLASDWIVEWPGYAVGFGIAGASLTAMALLLFVAPVPLYAAVLGPLAATFVAGFAVAGRLAGLKAPASRPRPAVRALRRR
jgi:hypothetical protein